MVRPPVIRVVDISRVHVHYSSARLQLYAYARDRAVHTTATTISACMYPLHACLRRWVYEHATGAREHMRSRRYHGVHARLLPPQHPPNIPCLFADLVFFRGVRPAERPALRSENFQGPPIRGDRHCKCTARVGTRRMRRENGVFSAIFRRRRRRRGVV